jgi:hypothetical protein
MKQDKQARPLSRRTFLGLAAGAGAVAMAGSAIGAQPGARRLVVHRNPSCGCCTGWADHARRAGFAVTVQNHADMPSLKRRLGVPADLESCHTSEVAGYVIEGHVPLADVQRLLRERPRGTRGLAVPGMPMGSPGMEAGGARQPFVTYAFDSRGGRREYARHGGA